MSKIKESSTHFGNKQVLQAECMEVYGAGLISGQWTIAICCYLMGGRLRFGELRKRLGNITERMLTLQLKKLEENNLVTRTVYNEVPLRVEYELTPIGYEMQPIIQQLALWGEKHKNMHP